MHHFDDPKKHPARNEEEPYEPIETGRYEKPKDLGLDKVGDDEVLAEREIL